MARFSVARSADRHRFKGDVLDLRGKQKGSDMRFISQALQEKLAGLKART
jgi:hypothetical protein